MKHIKSYINKYELIGKYSYLINKTIVSSSFIVVLNYKRIYLYFYCKIIKFSIYRIVEQLRKYSISHVTIYMKEYIFV